MPLSSEEKFKYRFFEAQPLSPGATVASAFATGQLTRAWMPGSNNSALGGVRTTGISLGVDEAINLLSEFVPSSRPK